MCTKNVANFFSQPSHKKQVSLCQTKFFSIETTSKSSLLEQTNKSLQQQKNKDGEYANVMEAQPKWSYLLLWQLADDWAKGKDLQSLFRGEEGEKRPWGCSTHTHKRVDIKIPRLRRRISSVQRAAQKMQEKKQKKKNTYTHAEEKKI